MLKYFIDDNGEKISIEKALSGHFRDRYPLAYIQLCAEQRPWTGVPSVTQLLDGTRQQYLMILTDYGVRLDDQAFQVVGSRGHRLLENAAPQGNVTEKKLITDEKTGILDCIERYPDGKNYLIDYKTWGSFRVVRALGLEKEKIPVLDSDGVQVNYQTSGKYYQAGEPRFEWKYTPNPDKADLFFEELQLNSYRYMAEDEYQITIEKMMLFVIVRDGGLAVAGKRGIKDKTISIPIRELEYDTIKNYFSNKRNALIVAIGDYTYTGMTLSQACPRMCDNRETWNGKRCRDYCPVYDICQEIG